MAKSFKCNNFGNCAIADADQVVQLEVTAESEPRCEKCNQPLEEVRSGSSRKPLIAVLGLGLGTVIILALAWFLWPHGQSTGGSEIEFVSPGEIENTQLGKLVTFRVQTNPEATLEVADGLPKSATFNRISGVFEWTPTAPGEFLVTFNAEADGLRGTHVVKIVVGDGKQATLQPASISGSAGQALTETIVKLVGRQEPLELDKGGLPPGIQWDAKRQALSGMVDKAGTYRLQFFAVQDGKRAAVGEVKLVISVGITPPPDKLALEPNQAVRGELGKPIAPVSLRANRPNATFQPIDPLPAGLVLGTNGQISGTPTESMSKRLRLEVKNGQETAVADVLFDLHAQGLTDAELAAIYDFCMMSMARVPGRFKTLVIYERELRNSKPNEGQFERQIARENRSSLEGLLAEINTSLVPARVAVTGQQWRELLDRRLKDVPTSQRDEWRLKARFLQEAFENPGTPEQLIEMGRKIFLYE